MFPHTVHKIRHTLWTTSSDRLGSRPGGPPTGPDSAQAGLRPVGPQISWDVLTRVMITTTASTTAQVPYWISVRF